MPSRKQESTQLVQQAHVILPNKNHMEKLGYRHFANLVPVDPWSGKSPPWESDAYVAAYLGYDDITDYYKLLLSDTVLSLYLAALPYSSGSMRSWRTYIYTGLNTGSNENESRQTYQAIADRFPITQSMDARIKSTAQEHGLATFLVLGYHQIKYFLPEYENSGKKPRLPKRMHRAGPAMDVREAFELSTGLQLPSRPHFIEGPSLGPFDNELEMEGYYRVFYILKSLQEKTSPGQWPSDRKYPYKSTRIPKAAIPLWMATEDSHATKAYPAQDVSSHYDLMNELPAVDDLIRATKPIDGTSSTGPDMSNDNNEENMRMEDLMPNDDPLHDTSLMEDHDSEEDFIDDTSPMEDIVSDDESINETSSEEGGVSDDGFVDEAPAKEEDIAPEHTPIDRPAVMEDHVPKGGPICETSHVDSPPQSGSKDLIIRTAIDLLHQLSKTVSLPDHVATIIQAQLKTITLVIGGARADGNQGSNKDVIIKSVIELLHELSNTVSLPDHAVPVKKLQLETNKLIMQGAK